MVIILVLSHKSGNELRAMDFALDSVLLAASLEEFEVMCDFVVAYGGVKDDVDDCKSEFPQISFGS